MIVMDENTQWTQLLGESDVVGDIPLLAVELAERRLLA